MNTKLIISTALAIACVVGFSQRALAHATSIGFESSGSPGSVNIWLGTYGHGSPTTEGSLTLVGVNGNTFASTTVAFNLLVGEGVPGQSIADKPTGLIDGTTNFYTPNGVIGSSAPLIGSETPWNTSGCPACGPTNHWQGVTFAGLTAGSYQFTWVPANNPSQEWSLYNTNMNGIFDLTGVITPPTGVPEPGMLALFGLGLAAFGIARRRRPS